MISIQPLLIPTCRTAPANKRLLSAIRYADAPPCCDPAGRASGILSRDPPWEAADVRSPSNAIDDAVRAGFLLLVESRSAQRRRGRIRAAARRRNSLPTIQTPTANVVVRVFAETLRFTPDGRGADITVQQNETVTGGLVTARSAAKRVRLPTCGGPHRDRLRLPTRCRLCGAAPHRGAADSKRFGSPIRT